MAGTHSSGCFCLAFASMRSHGRPYSVTDTDENEPDLKQMAKTPMLSRLRALPGFASNKSCTVAAGESGKPGRWLWSNLLVKATAGLWPLSTCGLGEEDEKCQCSFAGAEVSVHCLLACVPSSFILVIAFVSVSVLKDVGRLK